MNKFLSKLPFFGLVVIMCGLFSACDDKNKSAFSVSVHEVGPGYVELAVTAPNAVQIAYIVDEKEKLMNNADVMFVQGKTLTVKPDDIIRISDNFKENTQYYLYLVAKLDAQTYSKIYTIPFKTTAYELSELLTVVDRSLDGYKMRVTVPQETKDRDNAIRYNQCCLMMYNSATSRDDYFSLLYNAGKYVKDNTTLVYSEEENWYQTGTDEDGDGEIDWDSNYNPISPGEPVVFVAGEFSWMEDTPEYENKYFTFPSGWDPGYYVPMIDTLYYSSGANRQSSMGVVTDYQLKHPMDDYWTGAFQRKHFIIQEPEPMDPKVEVKLAAVSPIDATLEFWPEEGVDQFAFGIFDDTMYNELLKLLNGKEEYVQWAITSYFAAYTFGTKVAKEAVQANLTSFYYQDAIKEDTEYHVLVTAMGDAYGSKQSFTKFSFKTTTKVLDAPEIVVTAVEDQTSPYSAVFNIKCTSYETSPVTQVYYGANYVRDWLLEVNGGKTYFGLVSGNYPLGADEIAKINSEEGYTIAIPSIDGETTRLVVVGYNEEYTPNNLNYEFIEECPAVADCTTPYTEAKPYVDEELYLDLTGDWTATATLTDYEGKNYTDHQSKITLAADLYDYPETLSDEVYEIYAKTGSKGMTKEEVDAMWYEFQELAEEITRERLQNQNRLVGIGWLDKDSYKRLSARTPYDLFVATDYNSIDVTSLYNDYGPKWYLETSKDDAGNVTYSIPIDANFLPPAANWSVPFYLGAMEPKNFVTITYGSGWTPSFPVTVSEDRNTITIYPLVHEGVKYYPNMIGIDYVMSMTILENPVVSEVVLTRGWTEPAGKAAAARTKGHASNVQAKGDFPKVAYKQRTELKAPVELKQIDYPVMTIEQHRERVDRLFENLKNQNNQ